MEAMALMYIILGIIFFFAVVFILIFIAGKDIFYAFKRKLNPNGVDIFLLNFNRQVEHFFKKPNKEGILRLKGDPYIINPSKVLSLGVEMRNKIDKSLKKREMKIKARIMEMEQKAEAIKIEIKKAKEKNAGQIFIAQLEEQVQMLMGKAGVLREQLNESSHLYYHRRRPMLMYVEKDPVPKDMFEFYTEMDSTMIDNIIARTMTKDPKATNDLEKTLKLLKFLTMVAAGAAALAVIILFYQQNTINQLIDHLGITIKI